MARKSAWVKGHTTRRRTKSGTRTVSVRGHVRSGYRRKK